MSFGEDPRVQMVKAARSLPGWRYRDGRLVHVSSGLEVIPHEGIFVVRQYPGTRYMMVDNCMRAVLRILEFQGKAG